MNNKPPPITADEAVERLEQGLHVLAGELREIIRDSWAQSKTNRTRRAPHGSQKAAEQPNRYGKARR